MRPLHKEEFHNICLSVTGQGCGFQPEHAIAKKKLERHKESAGKLKCLGCVKLCKVILERERTPMGRKKEWDLCTVDPLYLVTFFFSCETIYLQRWMTI